MIPRLRTHFIYHRCVFLLLRQLQTFLPSFKLGGGVGHRIVQPQTIEIISEIVVIADIFLRLSTRVRLKPETQSFVRADQKLSTKVIVKMFGFIMNQIHEGLQIGRRPSAFEICIAESQIAFAYQSGKDVTIMNMYDCDMSRFFTFGAKDASIRQDQI